MPDTDEAAEDDGPGVDWWVHLNQVERLDREDGDEGEEFFSVEFELSGLGVSGILTALVVDPVSEASVIAEALQQLQAALGIYARVVRARRGAELGADAAEQEATDGPSSQARVAAVETVLREALAVLPARGTVVDRVRQMAEALEREAALSGDQGRREHAVEVRAAVERLTE